MDTLIRSSSSNFCMQASVPQERSADRTLVAIGVFKILKGVLFLTLAVIALRLFNHDAYEVIHQILRFIGIKGESRFAQQIFSHFGPVMNSWRKLISPLLTFYSILFFIEGIGLMLQKRWAEYFTIIMTASLIPIEIYELVAHPNWLKFSALIINIGIVGFLVFHLRRQVHVRYKIDAAFRSDAS